MEELNRNLKLTFTQSFNRILTYTVWCLYLGQFVLYSTLKLKHELAAKLSKTWEITLKYLKIAINVNVTGL